jgi:hypothetical protein
MSRSNIVGYVNGRLCKLAVFKKISPGGATPLNPCLKGALPKAGPPQLESSFSIFMPNSFLQKDYEIV